MAFHKYVFLEIGVANYRIYRVSTGDKSRKGKMTFEVIVDFVSSLSFDELRDYKADIVQ